MQTDRTIPNIKTDNIIRDKIKKKGICMVTNVAILGARNVITKEAEKILKYKDLKIEIQFMWNVKAKVISVITRRTGTISKSLRQYLSNIPGKCEIKEWALHTYYGKCQFTSTKYISWVK